MGSCFTKIVLLRHILVEIFVCMFIELLDSSIIYVFIIIRLCRNINYLINNAVLDEKVFCVQLLLCTYNLRISNYFKL